MKTNLRKLLPLLALVVTILSSCSSECCTLSDGSKACKSDGTAAEWSLFKSYCDLDPECDC